MPASLSALWISRNYESCLKKLQSGNLVLECEDLENLDSAGAAFFSSLQKQSQQKKTRLTLRGLKKELKKEFEKFFAGEASQFRTIGKRPSYFFRTGVSTYKLFGSLRITFHLLTECLYWSTLGLFKQKTILPGSTLQQMMLLGSSALPIVLLLSFLIGLTLAIQSAVQLEKFGASIYLASGIGISMVTEIGPMMTAVIIAGRSGSAITAEISTMVVQEELRALKTMGIQPIHFLLLPRFWALSLMLPLLTVCADLIGVVAGLLVSSLYAGVPSDLFFKELSGAVTYTMVWQSMLKVLVFSWIITLVAVYCGFTTRGGADAVGKSTTTCVVASIFSIILADAVFSFLFYF